MVFGTPSVCSRLRVSQQHTDTTFDLQPLPELRFLKCVCSDVSHLLSLNENGIIYDHDSRHILIALQKSKQLTKRRFAVQVQHLLIKEIVILCGGGDQNYSLKHKNGRDFFWLCLTNL